MTVYACAAVDFQCLQFNSWADSVTMATTTLAVTGYVELILLSFFPLLFLLLLFLLLFLFLFLFLLLILLSCVYDTLLGPR